MLRKIIVLGIILFACSDISWARTAYKGEIPHYKGELPPPPPVKISTTDTYAATDTIPCVTNTFSSGPYVGLNPGLRTNYNNTPTFFKAFEGTLSAGYAMLNGSFYLGSEVFVQHDASLQNYKIPPTADEYFPSLKTTWGFGIGILPGFVLADAIMGFTRIGVVRTHFNSSGGTGTGGQVGVGLQGVVAENWDVRAQYIYSFYQSLPGLGHPRSDMFSMGFIYKF